MAAKTYSDGVRNGKTEATMDGLATGMAEIFKRLNVLPCGRHGVWIKVNWWLTALLVIAIAAFTWRAYKSVTPYGWM